ncbi:MAG: hypothetical protein JWO06_1247 [Bacteroidota bacterium]|nr:hypothetical protein [Bacteroidota bacterium]
MNVAIVIGVSKYVDSKNNLPGCKNDAEAIYRILQKTDKFENILYINEEETSSKTKELITNFILANKGKQIDELLFYYSGHGEFTNEEFYYILSDFDAKKRKQSSLQNSEVDDLIRTLSPHLVVKIIDACQSRTTYIKESNVLSKYFNESKQGFKKCYFLNSSLNSQASYQDKELSYFTFSFIKALKEHKTDEIRYKDIIDVISDEFESVQDQTPFFVIQADLTEKFCFFSKGLREYLNPFTQTKINITEPKSKPLSIADLVKQDAKNYIDKEGALQTLEFIHNKFASLKLSTEISELFTLGITFLEDYKNVPEIDVVGNWVEKNSNEYFVTLIEDMQYDEDGTLYPINVLQWTVETPFKAISIDIISQFPNLENYNCTIVFLLSKKSIRFFYFITNYIEESWDNKSLNTKNLKWTTIEQKIADKSSITEGVEKIFNGIQSRIDKELTEKFKILTGPEATEDEIKPDDKTISTTTN